MEHIVRIVELRYSEYMKIRNVILFFSKNIYERHCEANLLSLSAEAAYYLILNIVPFIMLFVNVLLFWIEPYSNLIKSYVKNLPLGMFSLLEHSPDEMERLREYLHFLPFHLSELVEGEIDQIIASHSEDWIIISILLALWASTEGLAVLVRATDTKVYEKTSVRSWFIIRGKALAFAWMLVLLIAFTLIATVFGDAFLYGIQGLAQDFPIFPKLSRAVLSIWDTAKYLVPFLWLVMTLTVFYHFAPMYRPKFKETFCVALIVTMLWLGITLLYSYYMTTWSTLGIIYGALFSIVLLFVWVRLLATFIIFGGYFLLAWRDFDAVGKGKESQKCIDV